MSIDIGEQIITAAMTGTINHDTADSLQEIHIRVIRNITCPVTGRVMDSRTAHLITITNGDGENTKIAVHPDAATAVIDERLHESALSVSARFDPTESWAAIA